MLNMDKKFVDEGSRLQREMEHDWITLILIFRNVCLALQFEQSFHLKETLRHHLETALAAAPEYPWRHR